MTSLPTPTTLKPAASKAPGFPTPYVDKVTRFLSNRVVEEHGVLLISSKYEMDRRTRADLQARYDELVGSFAPAAPKTVLGIISVMLQGFTVGRGPTSGNALMTAQMYADAVEGAPEWALLAARKKISAPGQRRSSAFAPTCTEYAEAVEDVMARHAHEAKLLRRVLQAKVYEDTPRTDEMRERVKAKLAEVIRSMSMASEISEGSEADVERKRAEARLEQMRREVEWERLAREADRLTNSLDDQIARMIDAGYGAE